jgi:hypothetical protein
MAHGSRDYTVVESAKELVCASEGNVIGKPGEIKQYCSRFSFHFCFIGTRSSSFHVHFIVASDREPEQLSIAQNPTFKPIIFVFHNPPSALFVRSSALHKLLSSFLKTIYIQPQFTLLEPSLAHRSLQLLPHCLHLPSTETQEAIGYIAVPTQFFNVVSLVVVLLNRA